MVDDLVMISLMVEMKSFQLSTNRTIEHNTRQNLMWRADILVYDYDSVRTYCFFFLFHWQQNHFQLCLYKRSPFAGNSRRIEKCQLMECRYQWVSKTLTPTNLIHVEVVLYKSSSSAYVYIVIDKSENSIAVCLSNYLHMGGKIFIIS